MPKDVLTEKDILYIFTDGSMFNNPRRGGIGVVFVTLDDDYEERPEELKFAGYKGVTNNEMELKAASVALKEALERPDLEKFRKLILFTDSMYLKGNVKTNARFYWPRNSWRDKNDRPIENVKLWEELIKAENNLYACRKSVDFEWVKSHKVSKYNKVADRLAKESAQVAINKPFQVQSVRRKVLPGVTKPNSVEMHGQRLIVYIQDGKALGKKRGYEHRYQVLSKRGGFHNCTDKIFINSPILKAGHYYIIRVNSVQKYQQIVKVYSELDCKNRKRIFIEKDYIEHE